MNAFKTGAKSVYIVPSYLLYLAISIAITVWVARSLSKNGRIFLVNSFHGNAELADSINHLLVVGFYLINIGYVTLSMRTSAELETVRHAVELITDKIGLVLLVLGVMHFGNLYIFNRLRNKRAQSS
jgi:hypothetical protein